MQRLAVVPFFVVALCSALTLAAQKTSDIAFPLEDGSIVVQNPHFLEMVHGMTFAELSFTILNHTGSPWKALKLRFDILGDCEGQPRRWSHSVTVMGFDVSPDDPFFRNLTEDQRKVFVEKQVHTVVDSAIGSVRGCTTEAIDAVITFAQNAKTGEKLESPIKSEPPDVIAAKAEQYRIAAEERAKKDAEERRRSAERAAAEAADQAKKAAAEGADQAKRAAAEAEREKRLAAEQKKKDAALKAQIRAFCAVVYHDTANKKVSDLTVTQEQDVRWCQREGLYSAY
jgi:hypothetical protein